MLKAEEIKFGRRPSPLDRRDFNLKNFIPKEELPKEEILERDWEFPNEVLDQENTGHCVGFSMADFKINLPTYTPQTNQDAHNLYFECKKVDGYDGEGTDLRSACKVLKNFNIIENYAFAYSLSAIKWWLLNRGPLIAGTVWTSNMLNLESRDDELYVSDITGSILGGHAYLLNEWRSDGYIGIQNSWGEYWGKNGKAYILATDLEKLFSFNGEAVTAVELENKTSSCLLTNIFNKIKIFLYELSMLFMSD